MSQRVIHSPSRWVLVSQAECAPLVTFLSFSQTLALSSAIFVTVAEDAFTSGRVGIKRERVREDEVLKVWTGKHQEKDEGEVLEADTDSSAHPCSSLCCRYGAPIRSSFLIPMFDLAAVSSLSLLFLCAHFCSEKTN